MANQLLGYALTSDEVTPGWGWLMEHTRCEMDNQDWHWMAKTGKGELTIKSQSALAVHDLVGRSGRLTGQRGGDKMSLPNPIQYHAYTGQDLPRAWPYAYLFAAEGVYKVVSTPYLWAYTRLASCRIAGLCQFSGAPASVQLHVPKVPASWLRAVLCHAREAGSGDAGYLRPIEQMYHLHHFPDGWRVAVPRQHASVGRVRYHGGDEPTVVMDLHSHHEMRAFFSEIDNRDEQGCRLYAVIGRIYSRPEIRVRLGMWGDFVEVDPAEVFEGLGEFAE